MIQSRQQNNLSRFLGMENYSNQLTIGTLNYSGILTSPYQYHEHQSDIHEQKLQKIFREVVIQETHQNFDDPRQFSWNMGNIDVFWKTRLSPVNAIDCGVKENGTMMNEKEFCEKWEQYRQRDQETVVYPYYLKKYQQPKQARQKMISQVNRTKIFDLCCYKALMKAIYGIDDLSSCQISSEKYLLEKKKDFSKPYLCHTKKSELTINMIRKIRLDVLCLQEIDEQLLSKCELELKEEYFVSRKNKLQKADSVILFKKRKFPILGSHQKATQINQSFFRELSEKLYHSTTEQFIKQVKKQIDLNNKTSFQKVGNLLFFCFHISSKKQQHSLQVNALLENLSKIKSLFPKYKIICAGDINGKLPKDSFIKISKDENIPLHICPNSEEQITSNKKRTLMQPQRNKGNKVDYCAKDFIFSECKIYNVKIMMATSEEIDKKKSPPLLPNSIHPYDHYIVKGTVVIS